MFPYCIYSLLICLLCAYAIPVYSRLSPNLLAFTILNITLGVRWTPVLLSFCIYIFFFLTALHSAYRGFPGGSVVKNLPARRRCGFDPWVRKIPWRRQWQPTPVFLPGKPPQRRLAGYKMWCHKSVRHDSVTKQQHRTYIGFSIVFSFFKKREVLNILKYINLKCGVQWFFLM